MLIDTHCHLYDEAFRDDFSDVLERAREAGVEAFVMPGIDSSCHDAMLSAADRLPGVAYPCIGLHPTSVDASWEKELDFVREHLSDRRFYAIGEIGLDEYWSKEFVKEQTGVKTGRITDTAIEAREGDTSGWLFFSTSSGGVWLASVSMESGEARSVHWLARLKNE